MNNMFTIIGRINRFVNDKVYINCTRQYKNVNGEYLTDIVPVKLFGSIATNVHDYCQVGDLIGIKGRIEQLNDSNRIILVAEKVTFLSSKKESE